MAHQNLSCVGSFCEYQRTNDVIQKKQQTEFNSKIEPNYNVSQTKEGQCALVLEERPHLSGEISAVIGHDDMTF